MIELKEILDRVKSYWLAVIAVLYTCGLICWCFYSWENNLGHVDALQLQYVVAGIIPSIIIFYFFWLFKYSKKHTKQTTNWLERNLFILRLVRILLSLGVLVFLVDIIFKIKIFEKLNSVLPSISTTTKNLLIFLLFNLIIILSPALLTSENETSAKKSKFILLINYFLGIGNLFVKTYLIVFRFFAIPFVILFAILMLDIYYFDWYPVLPQEIGGVKPKNAIMLIDTSTFSREDYSKIFFDSTMLKAGQTDTLDVYFYNDNKVIFKTHKEVKRLKSDAETFEIARSSIKSVKWLN